MSLLMRATEVEKRVVVTLGGDDVAQLKDVVYSTDGEVVGFTLNGRGLFAGPRKDALPWAGVTALGPDAVVIADETVFVPRDEVVDRAAQRGGTRGGHVIGSRVLTDAGVDLGEVTDVVLEVDATRAVLVGYQIKPSDALGEDRHTALIPLPAAMAVSGENLMVPAAATDFVTDDLAGFGAAVDAFRARLAAGPGTAVGPGTGTATDPTGGIAS